MNPWTASWLVIDTETTGPDPATCAVVELGAVRFEAGQPVRRRGTLINPGCPIPEEASAIHGITDAHVASAPRLEDVAERFLTHVQAADIIVGYNLYHYDAPVLARLIGRAWDDAVADKPLIDPLALVRMDHVGRWWKGKGRHKLTAVCERFGIEAPGKAHRASADCLMTGRLLWALRDYCTWEDAYEMSGVLWFQAQVQQREFEEWLARQPKETA